MQALLRAKDAELALAKEGGAAASVAGAEECRRLRAQLAELREARDAAAREAAEAAAAAARERAEAAAAAEAQLVQARWVKEPVLLKLQESIYSCVSWPAVASRPGRQPPQKAWQQFNEVSATPRQFFRPRPELPAALRNLCFFVWRTQLTEILSICLSYAGTLPITTSSYRPRPRPPVRTCSAGWTQLKRG